MSDIVAEIAAALEQQNRGGEQVNQAVVQMDTITQQNAALVEQAAAAAHSLNEQVTNLNDAVAVFKVQDGESSDLHRACASSTSGGNGREKVRTGSDVRAARM
ncbi:hypothetical protein GD429_20665 [Burkholderia sp. BE17]|nr:hypothetical protein [Burkholderia sp. BE17]